MRRQVNGVYVELTQEEITAEQARAAAWELKLNTLESKDANRETLQAAREEVLDALILTESVKPAASQTVKDAAGIIRGR